MGNPIVIASGEVVNFPVPSNHPLAPYQQIQPVSAAGNLSDLAAIQVLKKANPNLSTTQISSTVAGILDSALASGILSLNLPDLTVQAGATMVLGGPINKVAANNVVIQGTLVVHGSLNMTCSQLGGGVIVFKPVPIQTPLKPLA